MIPPEITAAMKRAMERESTLRVPAAAPFVQGTPMAASRPAPANEWNFTIPGIPLGKPRMTKRDVWKKRKCVVKFRAWADKARAHAPMNLTADPLTVSWTAWLPMPESWSRKKRNAMRGQPHRQKPDRDNIDKGLLDALWKNDCGVAGGQLWKHWDDGQGPRLEVVVTTLTA